MKVIEDEKKAGLTGSRQLTEAVFFKSPFRFSCPATKRESVIPFTTAQLAQRISTPSLDQWAASTPENQEQFMAEFTAYFADLQAWITEHGGANPFGWNRLAGLTHGNGTEVVLQGPAQRAPFNDAFDDVRTHLAAPPFRLYQAAEALKRLINVLANLR